MDSLSNTTGVVLIVSGPSGVGKTTVCKLLAERLGAFLSVSMTTRQRREGEIDGQEYTFVSTAQFEALLDKKGLLEYAKVYGGKYYGTPAEPVLKALALKKPVILEIEIEGTRQVLERFPDAITVYLLAPTPADQQMRLVGRQQDSTDAIGERLSKADGEIRYANECGAYRHFIINERVEETVDALEQLVREKQQA